MHFLSLILLLYQGPPQWKRVIPMYEVPNIMHLMHTSAEKGGHAGRDSMINAIGISCHVLKWGVDLEFFI